MIEAIRSDRPQSNDEAALWGLLARELRGAAVFLLDANGRLASWSPGVRELLGYEESEWVGRPGAIIFTPEDRSAGEPHKELEAAGATEKRGMCAGIFGRTARESSRTG